VLHDIDCPLPKLGVEIIENEVRILLRHST
jgi:hypothetical protein